MIGSAFGRTGPRSLREALETLGFGPCHHMHEVIANPPRVAVWQGVARGGPQDRSAAFEGHGAQVDWPGAHVWRELAAAFPEAKVVHSVRPEASWWRSFSGAIGKLFRVCPKMGLPSHIHDMMGATSGFLARDTFGTIEIDEATALAAYRRREAELREAIPADRPLVFDVAEGCGPICAFLGVPEPAEPFPRRNERESFREALV
ncbi:MAG: sulfotransferase [Paracoccaceae bacterium]